MRIDKFLVRYLFNILISIDQFVNSLMAGSPDETISSRTGRRWPNSFFAKVIDFLFFWQNNHVIEAWENEKKSNFSDDDLI
jgi:hypothetical protein